MSDRVASTLLAMRLFSYVLLASLAAPAVAQTAPVVLAIDLTDAPRKILHGTETMPLQAGPLDLVFPKSISGEHGRQGRSAKTILCG